MKGEYAIECKYAKNIRRIAPRCDQQDTFLGTLFLNTHSKLLSTFSAKFRQKTKNIYQEICVIHGN